jgi:hypothetical protein
MTERRATIHLPHLLPCTGESVTQPIEGTIRVPRDSPIGVRHRNWMPERMDVFCVRAYSVLMRSLEN